MSMREQRRRTPAEINRTDTPVGQIIFPQFHLFANGSEVSVDKFRLRGRVEAAVYAAAFAERNMYVKSVHECSNLLQIY